MKKLLTLLALFGAVSAFAATAVKPYCGNTKAMFELLSENKWDIAQADQDFAPGIMQSEWKNTKNKTKFKLHTQLSKETSDSALTITCTIDDNSRKYFERYLPIK